MSATIRPAGALAALTAALAALTAAFALTACDTGPAAAPDAAVPPCRTASLTWRLSLLDGDAGRPGTDRTDARLTAVNRGPGACLFTGYPSLEIHNGKAESIVGTGSGHPAPLALPGEAAVTVALRYTPRGTEGAGTWCVRQHQAVVRAPHDTRAAVVPVEDARGKAAVLDACGETIAMEAPRRAANGS
ncbi:DUF4232 domain-containing protein [Streptomyces tricolor]|uniref:DUF4232 domain-containing protein n=1 Tax=Streptomyces tricolor TaxID=68277 RepID=UPI0036E2317C